MSPGGILVSGKLQGADMLDLIFLAAGVGLFAVLWLYISLLKRA